VLCGVLFIVGTLVANGSAFVSTFFLALMTMAFSAMVAVIILFHKQIRKLIRKIRKKRVGRIVVNVFVIGVTIAVLYTVVISAMMIAAMNREPPEDATLILHGAQVVGEQPSLILQRRMETALEFLQETPRSVAVLSGGLGTDATISEAEAMRRFLVLGGISDDRLFVEDRSTSTYENVGFSKIIIEEQNLSRNVAITTDGFHQFRAQRFARDAGLYASALPSNTPVFNLPYYWLRELAAITVQVVLGL